MTSELTSVQTEALRRFAKMRVGAAFMEQGMGKSRVAVELANLRHKRIDALLWVCPFSVKGTVEAEAAKWGLSVPARFVGYETISQSDAAYLELLDWVKGRRVMVVADESSFIKNSEAKRSERMVAIRRHCPYALALNGTPLTRDLWDIKNQMDWLDPRIIDCTSRQYREKYFVKHEYGVKGTPAYRVWYEDYATNIHHLRSLIAPYVIEAKFDFELEEFELDEFAALSDDARTAYKKVKDDFFTEHLSMSEADTLDIYRLLDNLARTVALDPERHENIAKNITGRCIVFCQYLAELNGIASHLGEHLVLTGDTSAPDRERILAEFRTGDVPLLMTYGVGSFGLNLQDANVLHLASEGFDYGRTQQAKSRIRRLGQKHPVTYFRYESGTGIEQMIRLNLSQKDVLAGLVRKEFSASSL